MLRGVETKGRTEGMDLNSIDASPRTPGEHDTNPPRKSLIPYLVAHRYRVSLLYSLSPLEARCGEPFV